MIWIWDVTTRQDKTIVENNQRGIASSRYQPGRYSDQERKVITFTSWYLNQWRAEPKQPTQASG
jgi:Rieske 2Fe-2S family protein